MAVPIKDYSVLESVAGVPESDPSIGSDCARAELSKPTPRRRNTENRDAARIFWRIIFVYLTELSENPQVIGCERTPKTAGDGWVP